MKKMMAVWLGFLLGAAFLVPGNIFAEESTNLDRASIEDAKETEANLASLPEGRVPMEEELEDEEVVDADA